MLLTVKLVASKSEVYTYILKHSFFLFIFGLLSTHMLCLRSLKIDILQNLFQGEDVQKPLAIFFFLPTGTDDWLTWLYG